MISLCIHGGHTPTKPELKLLSCNLAHAAYENLLDGKAQTEAKAGRRTIRRLFQ